MTGLEGLIARIGLPAVFLGTFVEGETALTVAGFAAHQGLLNPLGVWAAAFAGALCSDQIVFHLARRNRSHPRVTRALATRAGRAAVRAIGTRPDRFAAVFRFIFGLRIAGPVVIALSDMPPRRFLAINALAAGVWAGVYAGFGFFCGHAVEAVLGDLQRVEHRIGVALALAAMVALVLVVVRHVVLRSDPR
jgi:membrane protein DedA with SNARE-associated domain